MKLTIGFIPYLNMVPFHQGFGPASLKLDSVELEFKTVSPRALGLEAESGAIDAGAMSLMDTFRLSEQYESLGDFGIGVKRAAGSVLLFSKQPLAELQGICAVTDETATSVRLLQVLLEKKYQRTAVTYGRVAAGMFDGSADALLVIGDEALRARQTGVKGFPIVTDLATEWFAWQGTPFVFARWVVRKDLPETAKAMLRARLEASLNEAEINKSTLAAGEAPGRGLSPADVAAYWDGFLYKLTSEHQRAIETFRSMTSSPAVVSRGSKLDSPLTTAGNDEGGICV